MRVSLFFGIFVYRKISLISISLVTEDTIKFVCKILFRSYRRNKTIILKEGQIELSHHKTGKSK